MAKVTFLKSGTAYGFACFAGESAEVSDQKLVATMVAAKVVEVVETENATPKKAASKTTR